MALQKQIIPVPFAHGADTKTDPKQLAQGSLALLQNGVFVTPMQIRKRNGFAPLTNAVTTGGYIGQGRGLALYVNELLAFDPTNVYSYSPTETTWVSKGSVQSASVSLMPVVRSGGNAGASDGCIAPNGLALYANYAPGGVYYSVVDTVSGQQLVSNALIDATGGSNVVHCAVIGGYLMCVYQKGASTLQYFGVPLNAPTTSVTGVIASNVSGASAPWDMVPFQGNAANPTLRISYANNTASVSTCTLDSSLNVAVIGAVAGTGTPIAIGVWLDAVNNVWYTSYGTTTQLRSFGFNGFGTLVQADTVNDTLSNISAVAGIQSGSTTATNIVYAQVSTTPGNGIRVCAVNAGPTATSTWSLGCFMVAKPFIGPNGTPQVPVVYFILGTTTSQLTGLLLQYGPAVQPVVTARFLAGLQGGAPSCLAGTSYNATSGTWRFTTLQRDLLTTSVPTTNSASVPASVGVFSTNGVTDVNINFYNPQSAYSSVTAAGVLHMGGGFLQMYDGTNFVEHGFHCYPETPAAPTITASGGALSVGTYQWCFVYAWTDNTGRTHRSTPSIPVSVAIAVANSKVTFAVNNLYFTGKKNVVIEAYRTQANGSAFYREDIGSGGPYVSPYNTLTTTLNLGTANDIAIVGGQALYTAGGVLPNQPMPSCSALVSFANRVCAIASEFPLNFYYSQPITTSGQAIGVPASFSSYLAGPVDPAGGNLTALGAMDDKLLLFKPYRIYYTSGSGPDATGNNNSFTPVSLVTSDVGCTNQRSVVLGPPGTFFQSAKGIYLCNRSLQVSYIGAPMEAYVQGNQVVSAVLMASVNQIRFGLSTGITLTYDYFVGQWSVFTNQPQVAAVLYGGVQALLTPGITVSGVYQAGTTLVSVEQPGSFSDNGAPIRLLAQTGWLSGAGLAGFMRLYSIEVTGDYRGAHTLQISAAYDYNPNAAETVQVNAGTLYGSGSATFGNDATWGSGTPFGGTFPTYVFRYDPARQKCTAVQITIQDVQTGLGVEGCALSALTYLVGVKPGLNRLPVSQQMS
jgi:hypothetical protein